MDCKGSPNLIAHYNTNQVGHHSHAVDIDETISTATWHRFPYVQVLMCVKN